MAALTVKASAAVPAGDHAEKDAKPTPDPTAIKIKDADTATKAPARIAPHEAAGCVTGAVVTVSTVAG
jgi:hypothetical protein